MVTHIHSHRCGRMTPSEKERREEMWVRVGREGAREKRRRESDIDQSQ